ncbi:MAG TPA: hypothetical protein VGR62_17175 [Candidatus Binatia bacterium]|jgi:hypothetical protein|nr:hypothetical protein [Candidatus Binatia bacterium]
MSAASTLLDRLGRPGDVRLGTARPTTHPRLPTGLGPLDAVLDGGLPRGRITEVTGTRSAGRTGLACRIAATATAAGETIAWVDPTDALEPETVATAGVALARTLWVRPRDRADALRAAELLLGAGGFGLVVLDVADASARPPGGTPWTRIARAAERTRATLLVLGPAPQAGPAAALGLALDTPRACWSGGPGRVVLLDGITSRVTVVRSRLGGAGRAVTVRQACV